MIYIDFCKGTNGLWIGCAEYNNGRYFATGRTLDILVKNVKTGGAKVFRCSSRMFILSSKQMENGEFEAKHIKFASKQFRSRFWYKKVVEPTPLEKYNRKKVVVDGVLYDSISDAERTIGIKPDTFGQALRHEQTQSMGHSIAYADNLPQFKKPEIEKKEEKTETKYYYEEKNGILYVYERKLIAKYPIEKEV